MYSFISREKIEKQKIKLKNRFFSTNNTLPI